MTGFETGDVTVTGGSKGAFGGTGSSYTLVVTPSGGANVTVTVTANAVTDGANNTGPAADVTATAVWDATAPSVTITGMPGQISSTDPFTATFNFSESVTGFETGDVTVTGGSKGAFGGTGSSYTLVVTPSGGANVTVTVTANAVTDGANNTGPAADVTATAVWDATAPSVTITGVPGQINSTDPFTAAFSFSESVTGFETGDVTVTGGSKGAFGGTGSSYTLVVTPSGGANVTVTVAADAVTDGANNTGPAADVTATAVWDATAPSVTITGMPGQISSTDPFTATFNFSESVTGFETGDVTVTGGSKGAFGGTGSSYTLVVTPSGGANVTVTVTANAVTDGANNTGPAADVTATAVWDATAPSVTITGMPGQISSTDPFTATFNFSESVTGFETGDVTVTGGSKGAFGGTGSSYTLVVTPSGGANVTVTVTANAVTDGANNTGPAADVTATAVWDATAPSVTITGMPGQISSTDPFTATFNFSESVTGFETGDVTVTGGSKGAFGGTGSSYTLVVTPDGGANVTVTVTANAVTDGANNTGPAADVTATAVWDATAPSVTLTASPLSRR